MQKLFARVRYFFKTCRRAVERYDLGASRTVLAVTGFRSLRTELRVLALENGWHIHFAAALGDAIEMRQRGRIAVVLYDRDVDGNHWRRGLEAMIGCADPACVILLSHQENPAIRLAVIEAGGYDVARDPFDKEALARLVNGAMALEAELDDSAHGLHESHLAV